MAATTATNLGIAKQANAHARADFATWQMMAKLRSTGALPPDAQEFYASYTKLVEDAKMPVEEAAETTIRRVYKSYYAKMGGTGSAPRIEAAPVLAAVPSSGDNVTPFRRIAPAAAPAAKKRQVPALLIFAAMVAVIAGYKFLS